MRHAGWCYFRSQWHQNRGHHSSGRQSGACPVHLGLIQAFCCLDEEEESDGLDERAAMIESCLRWGRRASSPKRYRIPESFLSSKNEVVGSLYKTVSIVNDTPVGVANLVPLFPDENDQALARYSRKESQAKISGRTLPATASQ